MQIIICDEHLMFSEALSSLLAKRGHRVLARISRPDEAAELSDLDNADVFLTEMWRDVAWLASLRRRKS